MIIDAFMDDGERVFAEGLTFEEAAAEYAKGEETSIGLVMPSG